MRGAKTSQPLAGTTISATAANTTVKSGLQNAVGGSAKAAAGGGQQLESGKRWPNNLQHQEAGRVHGTGDAGSVAFTARLAAGSGVGGRLSWAGNTGTVGRSSASAAGQGQ